MYLSVIIPTYHPNISRLRQTLDSLKSQVLSIDLWELIIVDNNSSFNFSDKIDTGWHPRCLLIREPRQGLTYARIAGFNAASGDLAVLVDDDNILEENYLLEITNTFREYPLVGAIGGKSLPIFEIQPPPWVQEFYQNLALRDLGNMILINTWENAYPQSAPIGAGMALRKEALSTYIAKIENIGTIISDRTGTSLASGGDNDIILEILKSGWQVGYFPSLTLWHMIPQERTTADYLARLLNYTNRSWIIVLESHKINQRTRIARWTLPLRKAKAWFVYRAWANQVNYIKWRGACGTFDGLARIGY